MPLNQISAVDIIIWSLFGLIVGLVVHLFDKGNTKGGIFTALGAGVVGALLGGFFASFVLEPSSAYNLQNVLISIVGGIILVIMFKQIFKDKNHIKTIKMKLK